MTQSSTHKRRHQALALAGGALLALIVLITASAQPAVSRTFTIMAQEPAGVARLAPAEEPCLSRNSEPDFGLSVQPPEQWVRRTLAASYTVSVTVSGAFADEVYLEMEKPLPAKIEASLDPASLDPPGEATLTLATAHDTPPGTYRLAITGSSGDLVHTAPLTLTVPAHETFVPVVARRYDYVCSLHEPNDDRSEAYPLEPGREYRSYICPEDPGDYFSITLESPTTLILSLTNLTNLPPGVDYDLYLLNADGDWIAWSNAYGQVDEYIEYPVGEGMYYVQVLPYSGNSREVPYVLTAQTDP